MVFNFVIVSHFARCWFKNEDMHLCRYRKDIKKYSKGKNSFNASIHVYRTILYYIFIIIWKLNMHIILYLIHLKYFFQTLI